MNQIASIVSGALQIAIVAKRTGATVDEAIERARFQQWRQYTPESQAAAQRAIRGYYALPAKPTLAPPVLTPVQAAVANVVPSISLPVALTADRKAQLEGMLKSDLLVHAESLGVKVASRWTKAKIIDAILAAPVSNAA